MRMFASMNLQHYSNLIAAFAQTEFRKFSGVCSAAKLFYTSING